MEGKNTAILDDNFFRKVMREMEQEVLTEIDPDFAEEAKKIRDEEESENKKTNQ